MWIRRASRGRRDFPESWRDVAGNCGGAATAGVGPVAAAAEELVGAAWLDVGGSAGGVRGCAAPAGLGEAMAVG